MLVLGLDTSLQRCSAAILKDGAVVGTKILEMERGHAEHIAPMVTAILDQTRIKTHDLDRIGVIIGPGGFTGVRIALSFARGLVIGSEIETVAVTSLAALASGAEITNDHLVAPIIDARRDQVYGALYDSRGQVIVPPFVADPEQCLKNISFAADGHPVKVLGSGAELLPALPERWSLSAADTQIHPATVARIAADADGPFGRPAPVYLRAPDAKPPSASSSLFPRSV